MFASVSLVSHLVACLGFGALTIRLLALTDASAANRWFAAAALGTAVWAAIFVFAVQFGAGFGAAALLGETVRSAGWVAFLVALPAQQRRAEGRPFPRSALVLALAAVIAVQLAVDLADAAGVLPARTERDPLFLSLYMFGRLTVAVGGLVLVHNLYINTAPASRWSIRLLSIGLAALFAYDLNLYTIQLLVGAISLDLLAARGLVNALVVPLLLASTGRNRLMKLRLSRHVVFHTLSFGAIGVYLLLMSVAAYGLRLVGGDWGRLLQISFFCGMAVLAAVVLFSGRFRAWARVQINKHFFDLKYEYRDEWLRFIDTVSRTEAIYGELNERVIQAICQIVDSPGGALYTANEEGVYKLAARWNYQAVVAGSVEPADELIHFLKQRGRIIDFDELRAGAGDYEGVTLPKWAALDRQAWLAVPLLHLEQLAGFVVLERAIVERPLNWEDFDLLRTVGRQSATFIAEQASQAALMEARKFEEFNRRFAFIMHDIKNLVSQLSLVARNAERHADNPAFRADMVATLQSSVGKMNDLLARLGQGTGQAPDPDTTTNVGELIESVARAKRAGNQVRVALGPGPLMVRADAQRLEQVVAHLLQNALDASGERAAVHLTARAEGGSVRIEVRDEGCGMSASFIRNELFRPFHSTKDGGFGIGAYEAREITRSLGGRLDVTSAEGEGTIFTILLPAARQLVAAGA